MNWQWSDIYSHPIWMVSAAILAIIVRAQRKASWNPRACPVKLEGKTAIVTGANTGENQTFTIQNLNEWYFLMHGGEHTNPLLSRIAENSFTQKTNDA